MKRRGQPYRRWFEALIAIKSALRRELQLKLFPDAGRPPQGRNEVIRSVIFGVVQPGRREPVIDLSDAGPAGSNIAITGWRLDQSDLDIRLEVMHLARSEKPRETVTFSLRSCSSGCIAS